jgi:hypothetical protein
VNELTTKSLPRGAPVRSNRRAATPKPSPSWPYELHVTTKLPAGSDATNALVWSSVV